MGLASVWRARHVLNAASAHYRRTGNVVSSIDTDFAVQPPFLGGDSFGCRQSLAMPSCPDAVANASGAQRSLMEEPSSSPTSLGDEEADDEQPQLPQQLPQLQQQQAGYSDLDLAVDVAQLNARLRNGDFKRWWQDLSPPVVFSLGQQQYSPAGTCIVTSINAFLQAEARRYTAAGTLSTRRERLSELLGIRSRQVFLDKATKGGWVLLARQHGVQLADLTPLQPLFERLERPAVILTATWPTPQADEAVVQVLQIAAANVPDGVLAARTGSKAITAAIDALQAGGISGFRAPRVRGAGGHSGSRQRRRQQQQEQQLQQRQEEAVQPPQLQQPPLAQQLGQQPLGQQQIGQLQLGQQQLPLLVLLNQQMQHVTLPVQQQEQQQQQLSMLMLLSQQQQQLTQLVQPGIAMHASNGMPKDQQQEAGQQPQQAQQQQHQLHQLQQPQQQPHPQQQLQCMEEENVLQLEQQQSSKRRKQDASRTAEHARPAANGASVGAAGAGDSTAAGAAASGSDNTQQVSTPWRDVAAAAAAAAAGPADAGCQETSPAVQADAPLQAVVPQQHASPAHVLSPGGPKSSLPPAGTSTQQQLSSAPALPAGAGSGRGAELLWQYEKAQLAYNATVASAAAGGKGSIATAAAAAAAPGVFVLPWAQRQPWEWEWQQRQPASPRARDAADILMLLSGGRLCV